MNKQDELGFFGMPPIKEDEDGDDGCEIGCLLLIGCFLFIMYQLFNN